jgi:phage terminase large subunit-like protein
MWDLSCPDWEARIREGRSLIPALPLVKGEADLATAFYDQLRLPDVTGQPLLRDASGPWFREIVAALFGSYDPVQDLRYIREIFALVPKGNSKTSYGSGLMLTALLMNRRARVEFLFVGPTQAIANRAFEQAVGMIEADLDGELQKRFRPRDHIKRIDDRLTKASLSIKTFDTTILTGTAPAGVFLDELHLLGRSPAAIKVIRQIRGGIEKSTDGFLVIATTQSDDVPAGAFKDELMTARAIRDGKQRGRMLPVLYEFPPDIARDRERWADPANWQMVLPNLGRSVRLDSLRQDWETERLKGEHAIRVWASQQVNIEIGQSIGMDRWPGAEFWQERADESITIAHRSLRMCRRGDRRGRARRPVRVRGARPDAKAAGGQRHARRRDQADDPREAVAAVVACLVP